MPPQSDLTSFHFEQAQISRSDEAQAGVLAIKGQDSSPSRPSAVLYSTLILFGMNSTFKVAQSGYQLNIVPYTGPPPPKPKRLQAPPRREQIVEEYSLPDLPPDSVFDHVVDGPSPDRDADCDLTASVNVVRGGSVPPAQDFGGTEIDLPGKNL
jgi:hypothetical protein